MHSYAERRKILRAEIVANNNLALLNASPSTAAGRAGIREERVPHLSTAG